MRTLDVALRYVFLDTRSRAPTRCGIASSQGELGRYRIDTRLARASAAASREVACQQTVRRSTLNVLHAPPRLAWRRLSALARGKLRAHSTSRHAAYTSREVPRAVAPQPSSSEVERGRRRRGAQSARADEAGSTPLARQGMQDSKEKRSRRARRGRATRELAALRAADDRQQLGLP